jgi:cellobiose dehydrogenase (acceptor)
MVSWKALLALAPFAQQTLAQLGQIITDPDTGIQINAWTSGGLRIGYSLPANAQTVDADEFIGLLECPITANGGWCGVSYGGSMNGDLLLLAYPEGDEVYTSFRWSLGWETPTLYTGDAKLTQISSSVNSTHFKLIYRCEGCTSWEQDGIEGSISTSSGLLVTAWALHNANPTGGDCGDEAVVGQHLTQGLFGAMFSDGIANEEYEEWAALATETPGTCGGGGTPDPTATTTSAVPTTTAVPTGTPVPSGLAYDYIIVGGGAGGIPIADKLSEAGKKVLLIEKGPPSSGRWGGTMKPEWLEGTNLTRFDVPGLCNQIWADADGIACRDTDQMAGCVLGGGTAVNAALWWKPNPTDWDYNFPSGWKASDMTAATNRVFGRIPATTTPSQDGKIYKTEGYNVLANGLQSGGFKFVDATAEPGQKNRTFVRTPYMYSHGERGGPMATYLVSADKRNNFDMWTRTAVKRVIRSGGHITGVEVEPYLNGGYVGTVGTTSISGRVILSAGTFGSAKILMRSGIGPTDQLNVVKNSTDGPTMVAERDWINLPVGYNLEDHTNTDTVISHPNVSFYDFYEAYTDPIEADKNAYLSKRTGILAQSAPNIGPLFFEEIKGADNVVRSLQWTARVEGGFDVPNGKAMVMSQYLGRGAKSRGRMTISRALSTVVSTVPYLQNKDDIEAVIKGIENIQNALKSVPDLTWHYPAPGQSARDYVNQMVVATANRRANHWIGTAKISPNDGRKTNGDGVVDLNTKVYGTDNLFVVDASIFPGMVTTNPSAYIVVVSEHASQKILNLATSTAAAKYSQCGGREYNGNFQCAAGSTCTFQNEYYSQCL